MLPTVLESAETECASATATQPKGTSVFLVEDEDPEGEDDDSDGEDHFQYGHISPEDEDWCDSEGNTNDDNDFSKHDDPSTWEASSGANELGHEQWLERAFERLKRTKALGALPFKKHKSVPQHVNIWSGMIRDEGIRGLEEQRNWWMEDSQWWERGCKVRDEVIIALKRQHRKLRKKNGRLEEENRRLTERDLLLHKTQKTQEEETPKEAKNLLEQCNIQSAESDASFVLEKGGELDSTPDKVDYSPAYDNVKDGNPIERADPIAAPGYQKYALTRQLKVPGCIGDVEVSAVPDFGSSFDIIDEDLALRLGLKIDTAEAQDFRLPNGAMGRFVGTVFVAWSFLDEMERYGLVFHVLRSCICPVMLGRPFLDRTETLSKNIHRVQVVHTAAPDPWPRLLLVESPAAKPNHQERILGLVNGHPIGGLADTCSDFTIIKRSTALQIGLHIWEDDKYKTEVQFVDGSSGFTTGVVRDVNWCFSASHAEQDMHQIDVHVMDEIPCAFILDRWLLFDNSAFSEYQDCFFDVSECGGRVRDVVCMIMEKKRLKLWKPLRSFRRSHNQRKNASKTMYIVYMN
jgi:hypothetical protein